MFKDTSRLAKEMHVAPPAGQEEPAAPRGLDGSCVGQNAYDAKSCEAHFVRVR